MQETARPISELAEFMLRGPNTLTPGERELIAAYVSRRNECDYCGASHAAFAAAQLPDGMPLVDLACDDLATEPISAKTRDRRPEAVTRYEAFTSWQRSVH